MNKPRVRVTLMWANGPLNRFMVPAIPPEQPLTDADMQVGRPVFDYLGRRGIITLWNPVRPWNNRAVVWLLDKTPFNEAGEHDYLRPQDLVARR